MADFNRLLPNLDPNSEYIVRVRTYNQIGIASDWSESISFETPGDSSTPNPPSSLNADFTTPNLVLSWTAPTLNTDGSVVTDLDHYKIKLVANSITKFYETRTPYFSYTFNENLIDFGTAQPVITATVYSVDVQGNESSPITATATNARPADPTSGPLLISGFTTIYISMTPADPTYDVKGYDLYHSTDNVTFTLLANVNGDSYSHGVAGSSTHYYKFKVRDVFDQVSTGFSPVSNTTTSSVVPPPDTTPPADPSGLSSATGIDTVTQLPYIDLSWTANTDTDLAGYEIRFRKSGDSIFTSVLKGPDFTNHRIRDLATGGTYEAQIRAVDINGNNSSWKPTSPLSIVVSNGNVYWEPTSFGGIVIDSTGYIKSSNFTSGSVGWKLDSSGLEISNGTIRAEALQIGLSNENHLTNSSFENGTTVATGWTSIGTGTFSIDTTAPTLYQTKYQKITNTTLQTSLGVSQVVSVANGQLKAGLAINDYITVSGYMKRTGGTSFGFVVEVVDTDNSITYTSSATTLTSSASWYRAFKSIRLTAATTSLTVKIYGVNVPSSSTVGIDGVMLSLSSFPVQYAPATLEIPDNYIVSSYISSLTADKITAGTINAGVIDIGASGWIQSLDWTTSGGTTGYRLATTGATFQNGSISIIGAGGALTLDSTSMRLIVSATTKFLVNSTGVFIGGNSTSTAGLYYDQSTGKTVFQSSATGYKLTIDTSASNSNKIMYLNNGTTETFYLKSDGSAYFGAGIIGITNGSGGFNVDANGNIWQGTAASYAAATAFRVSATGQINTGTGTTFQVTTAGALTATNATITGNITSTSGTIGGWTIGSTTLTGTNITLDSSGSIAVTTGASLFIDSTYGLRLDASSDFAISGTLTQSRVKWVNPSNRASELSSIRGNTSGDLVLFSSTGGNSSTTNLSGNTFQTGTIQATNINGYSTTLNFQSSNITMGTGGALSATSISAPSMTISGNDVATQAYVNFIAGGYLNLSSGGIVSGTTNYSGILKNTGASGTANPANVTFVFGAFQLYTSSRRWKNNIENIDTVLDTSKVLDLVPRTWKSRWHDKDLGGYDDPNRDFVGLVAEEANDVDPIFITLDEEDIPNGIDWVAIKVATLAEVQKLRIEFNQLQKEFDEYRSSHP